MNHNHIYSDSVSCEQLKAVDNIFKEGHVCPTPPPPPPHTHILKQQQTNEKYTNIVQSCGTNNNTSWNIWESSTLRIECLSVSNLLVGQSILCLHLPQRSQLNDLILYFFSSDSDIQQSSQYIEVLSQRTQIFWLRGRQYGTKRNT